MGLGVVHSDRELFERERHCRHCLRVWLANRIMDLWQRVIRTCTEWTFVYSVIVMYYHLLKSYPHFLGGHELSQIVTALDSNWLRMQLNGTKLPRTVRAISMVINV